MTEEEKFEQAYIEGWKNPGGTTKGRNLKNQKVDSSTSETVTAGTIMFWP